MQWGPIEDAKVSDLTPHTHIAWVSYPSSYLLTGAATQAYDSVLTVILAVHVYDRCS